MARKSNKQLTYADLIRESYISERVSPVQVRGRKPKEPKPRTTPPLARGYKNRATPYNQTPIGQMTMMQRRTPGSLGKTKKYIKSFVGDVDAAMRQLERDVTSTMTPIERGIKKRVLSAAGRGVRGRKAWSGPRSSRPIPVTPVSAGGQMVRGRAGGGPRQQPVRAGRQMVRGATYRPEAVSAARSSTPSFMAAPPKGSRPKAFIESPFMTKPSKRPASSPPRVAVPSNISEGAEIARKRAAYRGPIQTDPKYFSKSPIFESSSARFRRAAAAVESPLGNFDVTKPVNAVKGTPFRGATPPTPNLNPSSVWNVTREAISDTNRRAAYYNKPRRTQTRVVAPLTASGMPSRVARHNYRVRAIRRASIDEGQRSAAIKKATGQDVPRRTGPLQVSENVRTSPVPQPPSQSRKSGVRVDTTKSPDQTPEKASRYTSKQSKPGGTKFVLPKPPVKVVAPSVSGTTKPVTTTKTGRPKVKRKRGPKPEAVIRHKASGLTATVTGRQVNITETATGNPFRPLLQLPYDPGVDKPLTATGIGEALEKVSRPEAGGEPSKKKIQRRQELHYLRHGEKISEADARKGILAERSAKKSKYETWLESTERSEAEKTTARMRKSPAITGQVVVAASKEAGLLREERMKRPKGGAKGAIASAAKKGARALGPVGGAALLFSGLADPAEAVGMTVDKVGGEGEAFQRKKLGKAGYAKMKNEEARYYARKRAKQAKLRKTYFGTK